jgi:hypothetical protein
VIDYLEIFQVSHAIRSDSKLEIKDRGVSVWVFEPATFDQRLPQSAITSDNNEDLLIRVEIELFPEDPEISNGSLLLLHCVVPS